MIQILCPILDFFSILLSTCCTRAVTWRLAVSQKSRPDGQTRTWMLREISAIACNYSPAISSAVCLSVSLSISVNVCLPVCVRLSGSLARQFIWRHDDAYLWRHASSHMTRFLSSLPFPYPSIFRVRGGALLQPLFLLFFSSAVKLSARACWLTGHVTISQQLNGATSLADLFSCNLIRNNWTNLLLKIILKNKQFKLYLYFFSYLFEL